MLIKFHYWQYHLLPSHCSSLAYCI